MKKKIVLKKNKDKKESKQEDILNFIKKISLMGLGGVSLTNEKIKKITKELIKEGELVKSQKSEFIKRFTDYVKKSKAQKEKEIKEIIKDNIGKFRFVLRKDFDRVCKKYDRKIKDIEGKIKIFKRGKK